MNYSEKLKHPKWQKKRLEILNRDNFTCKLCGDTETELHVHHLKYSGPNPENAPNEYLETLCKVCHLVKTNEPESKHGKFSKALKYETLFVVLFENKGIGLFYVEDNYTEHCMSFKENSIAFEKIVSFTSDNWKPKNI